MLKYSSFKQHHLLTEGWRKFLNEAQEQKKIFVLVGPPSVGKSTWISNTFGQSKPYIISRDDIAEAVAEQFGLTYDDMFVMPPPGSKLGDKDPNYGTVIESPPSMKWNPFQYDKVVKANKRINGWLYKKVKEAPSSGKDIVIDMTNMTVGARKRALEAIEGKESEYKKIAVVFEFEGSEDLIIQSAQKRAEITKQMGKAKTVPTSTIKKMFASYQKVTPNEGFDEVISVDNRKALQSLISGEK